MRRYFEIFNDLISLFAITFICRTDLRLRISSCRYDAAIIPPTLRRFPSGEDNDALTYMREQ
jgi:hypothetical protein